jgi:hypothetical protein
MVLPDRIELSTSPLPMECSTTELRQHARTRRIGPNRASTGGRFLPQGPRWRKHAAGAEGRKKREKITLWRRLAASTATTPGRSGSLFPSPRAASAFSGRTTTSNSIILRDSSNLMRSIPPNWPVADRGGKLQRGVMKPSRPSSIRCASARGSLAGVFSRFSTCIRTGLR